MILVLGRFGSMEALPRIRSLLFVREENERNPRVDFMIAVGKELRALLTEY